MRDQPLILIDPGHGGDDPGAVSGAVREADINLTLSHWIIARLGHMGIAAEATRWYDKTVSLIRRVSIANDISPDLFISIHCNAAASEKPAGTEIWTSPGQTAADAAAESILDAIAKTFPQRKLRADFSDGDADKESRFYVLVHTRCPAVLIELGFISNILDRAWLMHAPAQGDIAGAVASGIYHWVCSKGARQ